MLDVWEAIWTGGAIQQKLRRGRGSAAVAERLLLDLRSGLLVSKRLESNRLAAHFAGVIGVIRGEVVGIQWWFYEKYLPTPRAPPHPNDVEHH